jgi:hypothetical protein
MQRWPLKLASAGILLGISTPSYAGKVPLTPERLLAESKLIIVGQVQSHRDVERVRDDGSKTKEVFLTVRVESVEKGEDFVKAGDVIQAVGKCVVVVTLTRL